MWQVVNTDQTSQHKEVIPSLRIIPSWLACRRLPELIPAKAVKHGSAVHSRTHTPFIHTLTPSSSFSLLTSACMLLESLWRFPCVRLTVNQQFLSHLGHLFFHLSTYSRGVFSSEWGSGRVGKRAIEQSGCCSKPSVTPEVCCKRLLLLDSI